MADSNPTQSGTLRRYLAIVQDAKGYPAPGGELDPAPPEGAEQPMIYTVVKADEHEAEVERLRDESEEAKGALGALWDAIDALELRVVGPDMAVATDIDKGRAAADALAHARTVLDR